jgi:putative membrane protein
MKYLFLVLKGFLMGIANIIPGVSGGTIAIILGIYEELINRVSNIFKNLLDNIKFILPIGIGIVLSIVIMSGVIKYSYNNFPLPTMTFFVGLVLGGIPMLLPHIKDKKEKKKPVNYIIFLISFSIVIFMAISKLLFSTDMAVNLSSMGLIGYVLLFIVGMISAGTMIIPGISGSLVLMLLGYYYPIIDTIHSFVKFNNLVSNGIILFVFGIGVIVGIIVVSKVLEELFKNYTIKTYYGVLGFVTASVIAIPISTVIELKTIGFNIPLLIVALVTLVIGAMISYKLGDR